MDRSNEDWVEALSGRPDDAALEDLRRRLIRGLRGAFHGNRSVDDGFVEDIVQEALVKILRGVGGFRGDSKFLTWSLTIATRAAWTELRRKRWKDVSLDEVASAEDRWEPAAQEPEFESNPDRQALGRLLEELIRTRLTARQRQALLAEVSGMPQEEIGRRTSNNRNAVYKLVYDARRNLKRGLEEAGYGAEQTLAALER